MNHSTVLRDLMIEIDRQITVEKNKRPPGDRRRTQGQPPEGMQERRQGIDRRARGRKQ